MIDLEDRRHAVYVASDYVPAGSPLKPKTWAVVGDRSAPCARRGRGAELARDEARIQPAPGDQRLVGARLHHPPGVEDDDLIGVAPGGPPGGDDQGGAVARE